MMEEGKFHPVLEAFRVDNGVDGFFFLKVNSWGEVASSGVNRVLTETEYNSL